MTFRNAQERLLLEVRNRIRNGELTERAFARHLGVSQPHVNNVLQGRRNLSAFLADLILNFFHCSMLDLYDEDELQAHLSERLPPPVPIPIPVLRSAVGAQENWSNVEEGRLRYRAPCNITTDLDCVVLARLKPDSRMTSVLAGRDIALLDLSGVARFEDSTSSLFVVRPCCGTALRWVRSGARRIYLADDRSLNRPIAWEAIPLSEHRRLDVVQARVLWIGAESALRRA